MAARKPSPAKLAFEIRLMLRNGGSAEHAEGVQWFFKDEVKSHGWYAGALRKVAVRYRRKIREELGLDVLLRTADKIFPGDVLEEKIFAVFLLEKINC